MVPRQVGTATVTKLNSSVMDVSDEVSWNPGEVSSISHYLFAGKRLWLRCVDIHQFLKPGVSRLEGPSPSSGPASSSYRCGDQGPGWENSLPKDVQSIRDNARSGLELSCPGSVFVTLSRTVCTVYLLCAQRFARQSLLGGDKGM